MEIFFVRHGESTANRLHVFANGDSTHPLTETGFAQAATLANSLRGMQVRKITSSPVLRAVQTGKVLADTLQVPLQVSEALREWRVGIYEGMDDPAGWELHRQVQEQWFDHGRFESRMPGGESFSEIVSRFVPFIESLTAEPQNGAIILVGHGGLFTAMLPVIMTNITRDYIFRQGFPYTGVVQATTSKDGLVCRSWCGAKP